MILGVDFKGIADELLGSLEYPCVVRTEYQGEYDPATSGVSNNGSDVRSAMCMMSNTTQDFGNVSAVQVEANDKMCLLTADSRVQVGDFVCVDGVDWSVLQVFPVAPTGEVIMYKAHVRM